MKFKECLSQRFSCRDFIDYELSQDELLEIFKLASLSPSAANMQPAKICFFSGGALASLNKSLLQAVQSKSAKSIDLAFYPEKISEPYKTRRFTTGALLYEKLGISHDDKSARLAQWHKNYSFFNAKNLAILHIDENLADGALLDAGIFLANFINAATSLKYDTCVLGSIAEYGDIVRSFGVRGRVLCGVAIGKKSEHKINSLRVPKDGNEPRFFKEIL